MKKQILTRQDIQKDLLGELGKAKKLAGFLTAITALTMLLYILYLINFSSIMAEYTNAHLAGKGFDPLLGVVLAPIVITVFVWFLLDFYYIDLYRAATGKFLIVKETLCRKQKEQVSHYRRTEKGCFLYFGCGKLSVEAELYSLSDTGDPFYAVVLRNKKPPRLVYHAKYCEIENF